MTLTETTCKLLEDLRIAIEVFKGAPVRLFEIELGAGLASGKGFILIRGKIDPVTFIRDKEDSMLIKLSEEEEKGGHDWLYARYTCNHNEVQVANFPSDVWWTGTGFSNRNWKPIFE